jgi:hypothetical protein
LRLREVARILESSGRVAIIHWRKDTETRGPAVESRPDETAIVDSAAGVDLSYAGDSIALEPYHWGMQLRKADKLIEVAEWKDEPV